MGMNDNKRIVDIEAALEEVSSALAPFAEAAGAYPAFRDGNEYADQHEFQIRDLRSAAEALSKSKFASAKSHPNQIPNINERGRE